MTNDMHPHPENDASLPDDLRWQLRGLRAEQPPTQDLWPGIADRLAPRTTRHARPLSDRGTRRRGWRAPAALAASLLLVAATLGWRLPGTGDPTGDASVATAGIERGAFEVFDPAAVPARAYQREAAGLTREYQAAFDTLGAVPGDPNLQPALSDLDRSADLILDALAQQPDSRLLLDQLRRTYAQRLALSQRMLNT